MQINKEQFLDTVAQSICFIFLFFVLIILSPLILFISPFLLLAWAINRIDNKNEQE